MTPSGTELVQQQRDLVSFLKNEDVLAEIRTALPEGTSPTRFPRALQTALLENPDLLGPDVDRGSLLRGVLRAAGDGLVPDGREAALVVYKGKVGYLPMIQGVRKKIAEYGWSLRTAVVWSNDQFEYDEAEAKVYHRPPRLGEDRGERIGAYALAVHKDGRRELAVYDYHQIEYVRQQSSKTDKFWEKWPDPMWEKTPAHRLVKKLPLDEKDKARILSAFPDVEGSSSAVDMVYGRDVRTPQSHGPQAGAVEGLPSPAAPAPPAPKASDDGGGDTAAATADDEPLQEPTDEELDAMSEDGTDEQETLEGEVVDDDVPRFDDGKHKGETIQEVYDSGPRGQNYVRWAIAHWNKEPMRSALQRWADERGQAA